jgi:hypothetical protein
VQQGFYTTVNWPQMTMRYEGVRVLSGLTIYKLGQS